MEKRESKSWGKENRESWWTEGIIRQGESRKRSWRDEIDGEEYSWRRREEEKAERQGEEEIRAAAA